MTYCPSCGAEVQGKFCARCGASVTSAPPPPAPQPQADAGQPYGAQPSYAAAPPPPPQYGQQPYGQQGSYGAPPPGATPYGQQPPGATPYAQGAQSGLSDNVAGALCYLLGVITGVLFLVLSPFNQSKFVRFHAFQSIFFWLSWIALFIVETIISVVLSNLLGIFGSLIGMLLGLFTLLIWIGGIFAWIFLMYKAYNNEKFKLPIIGNLAEKQA